MEVAHIHVYADIQPIVGP